MAKLKKTIKKVNNPIPEVRPLWRVKSSFSFDKGNSYLEIDMSDNFEHLESPVFLLAEGIGNLLAQIKKLMPDSEAQNYNELVKEVISEIEKSLIHYS